MNKRSSSSNSETRTALEVLRATITLQRLRHEIELIARERGKDLASLSDAMPILAQIRISQADTERGASESPARQLREIAQWCVEFGAWPVALCFEAQSGHLTEKRKRRQFEEFRLQIERGELAVRAVVTYNIDRFTRDRYVGERWIRTLKAAEVDLHEADEMEPPRSLYQCEGRYADGFLKAWRESRKISKRIRAARRENARTGRILGNIDRYGHRAIWGQINGRRRQIGAELVTAEVDVLREATRRLHAGEPLSAIATDFNNRGLRGRGGGFWNKTTLTTYLTSPRMVGRQTCDGQLVPGPIEPILSDVEWNRNCALLKKSKGKATRRYYPLSGLGRCAVCGASITGFKQCDDVYYGCGRKNSPKRRHCGCGRPHGRCECSRRRGQPRHGGRNALYLEEFVVEIALAAHDEARLGRLTEAAIDDTAGQDRAAREQQLEHELAALNAERVTLAAQERRGVLSAVEAEAELSEILQRIADVEQALAALPQGDAHPLAKVAAEELRERIAEGASYLVRQLVERVVDHFVLSATPGHGEGRYRGIDIVFVDGYEPPAGAVDALRQELEDRVRDSVRLERGRRGVSPEDELLALTLHQAGRTPKDIAVVFNESCRPTAQGGPTWHPTTIAQVVRRACERRQIEYVPNKNTRSLYSTEVRNVVYELCSGGRSYDQAVADLEEMGIRPPHDDGQWTVMRVRACYANEVGRRGERLTGRRPQLPAAMRRKIYLRARVQRQSYSVIAEWLNANGVPRWRGRAWDDKAIGHIVRSEAARDGDAQ